MKRYYILEFDEAQFSSRNKILLENLFSVILRLDYVFYMDFFGSEVFQEEGKFIEKILKIAHPHFDSSLVSLTDIVVLFNKSFITEDCDFEDFRVVIFSKGSHY